MVNHLSFIPSVYKKTSNSPKNRVKIFDYIASYIGVPRDHLLSYAQKITIDPVEVRKYQKPVSSPTHPSAPNSSSILGSSFGMTSSTSAASKKPSSAPMPGVINLSTNQTTSSSYGEGLAGKLMMPDASTSNGSASGNARKPSQLVSEFMSFKVLNGV